MAAPSKPNPIPDSYRRSGFAEIDVADLDEALRLAKSWPACPVVEIRPIAST